MTERWLKPNQVRTYDLQMEFWMQRLYGRNIYFGNDPMKKYNKLVEVLGLEIKGTTTVGQLETLIPELESLYLERKETELHERHFSD